jgi:hypothetical protein
MTNQHPITPPLELVHQWADMLSSHSDQVVFSLAAQWGADQELEACCAWLDRNNQWAKVDIDELRDARRPKPPTLKEQALHELGDAYDKEKIDDTTYDTIRRALEALPND